MKTSIGRAGLRALFCGALKACLLFAAMGAQAATYTVTTEEEAGTVDSASCTSNRCTLRDAINAALANTTDADNTIQFSSTLSGATINLTLYSNDLGDPANGKPYNGEFGPSAFYLQAGTKPLTIDATQLSSPITIQRSKASGTANFRLFDVGVGATLTLRGLVLANGVAQGGTSSAGGTAMGAGGAVFSQGTLTLDRCTVTGNLARGGDHNPQNWNGGGGVGADAPDNRNGGGPNGGAVGAAGAGGGNGGDGEDGGFGGGGGTGGKGGDGSNYAGTGGNGGNGGFGGGGGTAGIGGYNVELASYAKGGNGGNGGFGGGSGYNGGYSDNGTGGFGGGLGAGAGMGGGVFNDAGSLTITNSTFTTNTAQGGSPWPGLLSRNGLGFGGAIFNYSGTLVLNGVTLSGNSVTSGTTSGGRSGSDGGAIYSLADGQCAAGGNTCNNGTNATLSMFNSVAVNNTGTGNSAPNDVVLNAIHTESGATSSVEDSGYNAIGAQLAVLDPSNPPVSVSISSGFMLATSLNNNVLPPLPGSPLIDAGYCNAASPALSVDQLGTARPQGTVCDIGAVEVWAPLLSLVSLSNTTSSGSKLSATSNIAATGYWLVVPTGSTAPTAGQIQAGSSYGSVTVVASGSGGMSANAVTTFGIIGLSPATSYDLYLVSTSASGGRSVVSKMLDWTTQPAQTVSGPVPGGGSGTITAKLMGPEGCDFVSYSFDPLPTGASAPPPGYSLPYGAFQFTTNAQCGGGAVSFTLSYPEAVPANAQYHKFGPTPSNTKPAWYAMPHISISGKSVTFQITDGQLGDDDLTANGVIVDGGGLTVPLPADVNAIPTLGEWALALLAVLMGGLGMGRTRRGARR